MSSGQFVVVLRFTSSFLVVLDVKCQDKRQTRWVNLVPGSKNHFYIGFNKICVTLISVIKTNPYPKRIF